MFTLLTVVLYHLFLNLKESLPKHVATEFKHKVYHVGHLVVWVGALVHLGFELLSLCDLFEEAPAMHTLLFFLDGAVLMLEIALRTEPKVPSATTDHS